MRTRKKILSCACLILLPVLLALWVLPKSATWPPEHTPCLSNTPLKAQTSNQKTTEIISRQANK
ncbi:hypothetical protein M404DRAFT_996986 [Pisolithus tinctorius Marx 270]|uniref:Uncharacterized protein n=1 Tax=Pisolithus tinctorius Marx 270 TaxID=870435 RepID=A0A0C3PKJ0_PISTI|nr:hypothetical protein M404DRAFT_996986 [Pisolithus tinctorius Marx 270]